MTIIPDIEAEISLKIRKVTVAELKPLLVWIHKMSARGVVSIHPESNRMLKAAAASETKALQGKIKQDLMAKRVNRRKEFFFKLKKGSTIRDAAIAVGVHPNTGYEWYKERKAGRI